MTKVIAAIDSSVAARPVLATARALAVLLGAEVEALYVGVDDGRVPRSEADAAGLDLRTEPGPVVERLIEVGKEDDVVALVLGARGTPLVRRPLGSTALAVATSLPKPVVVVPPDAQDPKTLRRVLVPLEESVSASQAPRVVLELGAGMELDVVVLHVFDEESIPPFTDQPQHEGPAWAEEFLARYCPSGLGKVRLEVRVGRTEDLVPLVAEEVEADMVVLGWAQELALGRAPVVRSALARARVPILLVPVRLAAPSGISAGRSESWSA
jgi:nucleotide-binding universal stress UspA family protein